MGPALRFGPFVLDAANAMFTRERRRVELEPKASDLLHRFALSCSAAGRALSLRPSPPRSAEVRSPIGGAVAPNWCQIGTHIELKAVRQRP